MKEIDIHTTVCNEILVSLDSNGICSDFFLSDVTESPLKFLSNRKGQHYTEALPLSLSKAIEAAIQQLDNYNSNKIAIETTLELENKNFTYSIAIFVNQTPSGKAYYCTLKDVTEMRKQSSLLDGVLNSSLSGIMAFKSARNEENKITHFRCLLANARAAELTGIKRTDLLGKKLIEIMPVFQSDGFQKYVEVVEKGSILDHEHYYDHEMRGRIWFRTIAMKNQDGFVLNFEDITHRKQAEIRLKNLAEEYKTVFHGTQTAMFMLEVTEDQKFVYRTNNEFHRKATGVRESKLAGMSPIELLGEKAGEKAIQQYFRCIDRKKPVTYEETIVLPTGYVTWLTTLSPIVKNDRVEYIIGSSLDITRRKQTEMALQKSEENYRLLADNMMDLVAQQTLAAEFTYLSPSVQKLLGYTPNELIGLTAYELVHPEDINILKELSHNKTFNEDDIVNVEYRIRKKDGSYVWFSTNTKSIKNRLGQIVQLQSISRDVTEKMQILDELKKLNANKNKIFSIISHDLRAPVANYVSLVRIIDDSFDTLSKEKIHYFIGLLKENADKIMGLVDELLTWSMLQFKKIAFKPEILSLRQLLNEVITISIESATRKNHSLSFLLEEDIEIKADKNMIESVLRNLIGNAIKFTPQNGEIIVKAKKTEDKVEITVEDNGVGIRKEEILHLFDDSNLHSTIGTDGERGTGLGLGICKDFVGRHGGTIWAESEYCQGSKFIFTIPEIMSKV